MGPFSIVFIANTGRADKPLPGYLVEALERYEQEEQRARYCLVAHDVQIELGSPMGTQSKCLGLHGAGGSVQYALLDMLSKFNPGRY